MKLPFKEEEFLGNIRSGKRKENNSPCNIDHFNVHYDSWTSEYSMELFESVYKDKTDKLLIMPVTNMIITQEVYKREGKCKGVKGKTAIRIDSNGNQIQVNCDPDTCEFSQKGKKKCERVGRIYFRLVGIEGKGIWCYRTGSKRMTHIKKYLDDKIEEGIDITKNIFLLALNETPGSSGGKVYAPGIKIVPSEEYVKIGGQKNSQTTEKQKIETKAESTHKEEQTQMQNNQEQKTTQNSKGASTQKTKNFYVYVDGKMVEYASKKYPRVVFMNKEREAKVFYMTKESKPDILGLETGSVIEITKVLANKNNDQFLMDYNIIKRIEKNKKAV